MKVIRVDVYTGRIQDPVDTVKIQQFCDEGWIPISVAVPSEIGQIGSRMVTAVFYKPDPDAALIALETKIDALMGRVGELLLVAEGRIVKKKGKN